MPNIGNNYASISLPAISVDSLLMEDSIRNANGSMEYRVAVGVPYDIAPDQQYGTWQTFSWGKVWRIKFQSQGAYNMMLAFKDFSLPVGASVFVYNDDLSMVEGPFTSEYELSHFSTLFIKGAAVTVEFVTLNPQFQIGTPLFKIKKVAHDYRDFYATDESAPGTLQPCHNDINCPVGNDWQVHKRSVVNLIYTKEGGFWWNPWINYFAGTGTLIRNTGDNQQPYVYMAKHVLDDFIPEETIAYFNKENWQCGVNAFTEVYAVKGTTVMTQNTSTDYALLKLSTRVPSSYTPYYAGWDRRNVASDNGTIIHHPRRNPKKISVDEDPLVENAEVISIGHLGPFPTGSLWMLNMDNGIIEEGSSGAALFNHNGKVVGNQIGGNIFCPDGTSKPNVFFGKFSLAWPGLQTWLDPVNSNALELEGHLPGGLRNASLNNLSGAHFKVHSRVKSISVGEGNQVFYRTVNDRIFVYYWDAGAWLIGELGSSADASTRKVGGDMKVGVGNQVFYRGQDKRMQSYYFSSGTWHHTWIGGSSGTNYISDGSEAISIGDDNQVYYRGENNQMYLYYFAAGSWHHVSLGGSSVPASHKISGAIAAGTGSQVYYRGADGKMQAYYKDGSVWHHVWIDSWDAPSNRDVAWDWGSIVVGQNNQIFYRGQDNLLQTYYFSAGGWSHDWVGGWSAANANKISGDITVDLETNNVFYRGTDGKMKGHFYIASLGYGVYDYAEGSWQAPTMHNLAGSMDAGSGGQFFYRDVNGYVRVYYWENEAFLRPKSPINYGMADVNPSPTIEWASNDLQEKKCMVYPNPTFGELNVAFHPSVSGNIIIELFDVTGKQVLKKEMSENNFSTTQKISLDKISMGIYVVRIFSKGELIHTDKINKLQ